MGPLFRTSSLTALLSAILISSACSHDKSLTRSQAAQLISSNASFTKNITTNVAIGNFCSAAVIGMVRMAAKDSRMFTNEPARPFFLAASLEPQGLVTLEDAHGFKCSSMWDHPYVVTLTPQGRTALQAWPSQPQQDGSTLLKPVIVTSNILEVTGIAPAADGTTATAEFTYQTKNTPALAILKVLHPVTEEPRKGSAGFRLYDDGWRLTGIKF